LYEGVWNSNHQSSSYAPDKKSNGKVTKAITVISQDEAMVLVH
jgi:hypothetical protein